ncbi:SAM-dependent methyltransferase [Paenibacillus lutrae]|uniref:Tetratricopeptide repeat protein n=1 Tax=Paenibacillus lutrae TaxID=2078573 RepID=A0A7X3FLJ6_9BACL|nr:SAM-dependent methyltransferase [Paenibacillus lutrae]MVP01842.1 tetratricopeptide repeat protein [Paenibacillus lutrae]
MSFTKQQTYRFSEAPIWDMQRSYYEEQGISAWQRDEVPHYITNNPRIGAAYAEIIFGFLQDRAKLGYGSEPVMILELGAGSGRLASHVLNELDELKACAGLKLPSYRYVMSDLAAKNLDYWKQHPQLCSFQKQGILDFAQFDAVQDAELYLTQSGECIRPADLKQPLLVIANYFFDSIPQELLYIDEGLVYECDVTMQIPSNETSLTPSELLSQVNLAYQYRRAAEYEQAAYPYRSVIRQYQQELEDSHVLFPVVGLECLERLNALSQEGFLLLTADKGDHRLENWKYAEAPDLIGHGSFSLEANYHAIGHVYEQSGAEVLFTDHRYKQINVGCILMLTDPASYSHTRLAYRRFINRFGPDDFFSLKKWLDEHLNQMELSQLLAFWRLGHYDAEFFLQCRERISELLPAAGEEDANAIRIGIRQMWQSYYPMEGSRDLAMECAELLYEMEAFEDALEFYERSSRKSGACTADTSALYHMAICCYETGNEEEAKGYSLKVLAQDPEHEGAASLCLLLQ